MRSSTSVIGLRTLNSNGDGKEGLPSFALWALGSWEAMFARLVTRSAQYWGLVSDDAQFGGTLHSGEPVCNPRLSIYAERAKTGIMRAVRTLSGPRCLIGGELLPVFSDAVRRCRDLTPPTGPDPRLVTTGQHSSVVPKAKSSC